MTPDLIRQFDLTNCFTHLGEEVLYKDNVRDIFRTASSMPTCDAIFGPFDLFRNWHGIRYGAGRVLKRLCQYRRLPRIMVEPPLALPHDAVVISKSAASVIVIASNAQQRVVKLEKHIHARRFQNIIQIACEAFQNAGMACHVPIIQGCGEIKGVFYTVSEICPNRPPFFRTLHGKNWPGVLERQVIPVLQRFHENNGVEVIGGSAWAERLCLKMTGRSIRPDMVPAWESILSELRGHSTVRMPICMISGDLQPQNIHFHRGNVKILDWSNIESAALITDVFCDIFYRGMVEPESPNAVAFWNFLAGVASYDLLPSTVRETAQVWRDWMNSWLGIKVDEVMLRTQLRAMCWDWMLTMTHPWLEDGSLWRQISFPQSFLKS